MLMLMSMLGTSFSNAVAAPAPAPSSGRQPWRTAMAPLTWAEIGANTLNDVNPRYDPAVNPNFPNPGPWDYTEGFPAIMASWSGGITDDLMDVHGGGHNAYGGNEYFRCDLNTPNPAWQMIIPPSGSIPAPADLDPLHERTTQHAYSDGRPRSTHTYNNMFRHPNGDVYLVVGSVFASGFSGHRLYRLRGTTWTDLGDSRGFTPSTYSGACYDPVRNRLIYAVANGQVGFYNIDTGASSMGPWMTSVDGEARVVHVPTHDVFVVLLRTAPPQQFRLFDPAFATPDDTTIGPPHSGTPPTNGLRTGVWVPSLGAIVTWDGGPNFRTLTPPAGNPRTGTWVWGTLEASASNTVTPDDPSLRQAGDSDPAHGVYGRFGYVPSQHCLAVVTATDRRIKVFALPD